MTPELSVPCYLVSSVCFILALRGLSGPEGARRGNLLGIIGMAIAIATTLTLPGVSGLVPTLIAIAIGGLVGTLMSLRIAMTALPQLIAAFHSLVGAAAVCVAAATLMDPVALGLVRGAAMPTASLVEMGLGTAIGAITFTGSVVAFAKLQGLMSGTPLRFPGQHQLNAALAVGAIAILGWFIASAQPMAFWALAGLTMLIGLLLILPIGGADMPVVVSMLNSYSGWAASGIGFTLHNDLLTITGALVGASGAILSYIMCKAMNRSILNVIFGGIGNEAVAGAATTTETRPVKVGGAEDAAFILRNSSSVIVVPGYGMAVAQAQHALRELADQLKKLGIRVRYAIHPVAGRMPGHMNVLLAEANVPYEDVVELEEINRDFAVTDVAFVIGANDITNPAALNDAKSPLYGMPILDVDSAKTVIFIKRSLSSGYAGIDNELFYRDKTMMLLGDAKKVTEEVLKSL